MNTFNQIGKHKHSEQNKSGSYGLRIVSVGTLNAQRETAVIAWSVRTILEFDPSKSLKRRSALSVTFTLTHQKAEVQYGLADGSFLAEISKKRTVCVMCMEADPTQCHRDTWIGRDLKVFFQIDTKHIETIPSRKSETRFS